MAQEVLMPVQQTTVRGQPFPVPHCLPVPACNGPPRSTQTSREFVTGGEAWQAPSGGEKGGRSFLSATQAGVWRVGVGSVRGQQIEGAVGAQQQA